MNFPEPQRLFDAIEATWPAERKLERGKFTLRYGAGGGQRVSAATANGPTKAEDISPAEQGMLDLDQTPIFMIREQDRLLDMQLANLAYEMADPTLIFIADAAAVARKPGIVKVFPSWPPLAAQRDIWQEGGVGPARLDVMLRSGEPKSSFLGRVDDQPMGTAFAAVDGDIAMLHALEIREEGRRQGLGRQMTRAIAHWAMNQGARWFTTLVVKANRPAVALYESLGMTAVSGYHYRRVQD